MITERTHNDDIAIHHNPRGNSPKIQYIALYARMHAKSAPGVLAKRTHQTVRQMRRKTQLHIRRKKGEEEVYVKKLTMLHKSHCLLPTT